MPPALAEAPEITRISTSERDIPRNFADSEETLSGRPSAAAARRPSAAATG
jgi:hypothetical protein